jgi:hypothetical protein
MKLNDIVPQDLQFDNWIMPSDEDLKREYKVEYILKDLPDIINFDPYPTEDSFLRAAKNSEIFQINKQIDATISNRSRLNSKEDLLKLIKSYRSYPKYRNEDTLDAIFDGFKNNLPMVMPIIFNFNNTKRVFSGNTRMDVAFILGINPKCIIMKPEISP